METSKNISRINAAAMNAIQEALMDEETSGAEACLVIRGIVDDARTMIHFRDEADKSGKWTAPEWAPSIL